MVEDVRPPRRLTGSGATCAGSAADPCTAGVATIRASSARCSHAAGAGSCGAWLCGRRERVVGGQGGLKGIRSPMLGSML